MISFLVKSKKPLVKWTHLKDNTFFEGTIPEGYDLAVSPSEGIIVVDVDKHGDTNGFPNIPTHLMFELKATLNYPTRGKGRHFWFKYTGSRILANKHSKSYIDLRVGKKGYVVWYPKEDLRESMIKVNESSKEMNLWLEGLFSHHKQKK